MTDLSAGMYFLGPMYPSYCIIALRTGSVRVKKIKSLAGKIACWDRRKEADASLGMYNDDNYR